MSQENELFDKIAQLSIDDRVKLLEVIKSKINTGEPLFDSFPEFETKLPSLNNQSRYFIAKYNVYQANSIFWILRELADSHGMGFDSFDKNKAFESINFLCEIGISTLNCCSEQIDRAEQDLPRNSEVSNA